MRLEPIAVLAFAGALAAPALHAQQTADKALEADIELLRADVRAQKADLVAKNMSLDAAQAAAFWPIYKQYEAERKAIGDERLAVIKDYAASFQALSDPKAVELVKRSIAIEEKNTALLKRYVDEMMKVLPAKTVARFSQVERRLNLLIDLETASQIPLVR